MIDTERYEGHSEMIDANEIGELWEYLAGTISEDRYETAEANYSLVADAPLILEAYKKLHERLQIVADDIWGMREGTWVGPEGVEAMLWGIEQVGITPDKETWEWDEEE